MKQTPCLTLADMIVRLQKTLPVAIPLNGYYAEGTIEAANAPIWHQQKLRCCAAMVICDLLSNHIQTVQKQNRELVPFSPLFLYYTARKRKAQERYNIDLSFADVFAAIKESGICPDKYWPFVPHKFRQAPPITAYKAAKPFRSVTFQPIAQDLEVLKNILADGRYVAFGLGLFSDNQWDFYSGTTATTGTVTMPADFSNSYDNHALLLVAYQAEQKRFVFRNSFGSDWGKEGYGYISAHYLLHPQGAFDFYTISSI